MFEDLQATNIKKGSKLILVYLPTAEDLFNDTEYTNLWRAWLKKELANRKILYFDLYEDFLALPYSEATSMFPSKTAHYTNDGHKIIGNIIYKRFIPLLKQLPLHNNFN